MKDFSLKYKIQEKLEDLNFKDYRTAIHELPKALNISTTTFNKYINTRIYEGYSMPADHLVRLASVMICYLIN